MSIISILLVLVAIYCGGSWLFLAFRSFRHNENWEPETFHLGLCFILAIGFLGLMGR
jgi:hypothetical protein